MRLNAKGNKIVYVFLHCFIVIVMSVDGDYESLGVSESMDWI
jgi:hypothetical protein